MTDFVQRQLDRLAAGTLDRVIAMTPIGRVGQAMEIAAGIDFLTSDQVTYWCVSRHCQLVGPRRRKCVDETGSDRIVLLVAFDTAACVERNLCA